MANDDGCTFNCYSSIVTRPENKTMTSSNNLDGDTMNTLEARYSQVNEQLAQACAKHGRALDSVQLLAVSKKHSTESIQTVHHLGQIQFGENYVQEGQDKVEALKSLPLEWHFIGPLQSNKTKSVAQHFHWMHTLDRIKIAKRLNEQRPSDLTPLNVLIQINISDQDSKSGVQLDQISELANAISKLPNLCLRGLMCIPAPSDDDTLKQEFLAMAKSFEELKASHGHFDNCQIDTLSMGMSGDLDLAVECGSTMVRIGTAIFGKRIN